MAKRQSFAHKSRKVAHVEICPNCKGEITPTFLCVSERVSGGCKFHKKMVKVCSCKPIESYLRE